MMGSTSSLMDVTEIAKLTLQISLVSTEPCLTSIQFAQRKFVLEEIINLLMNALMEMLFPMMDALTVLLIADISVMREILSLMMFAKRFVGTDLTLRTMNVTTEITTQETVAPSFAL